MADLGTAYVQIVPAAKGISGQITNILSPEAVKAGQRAGNKISGAIGPRLQKIGGAFQTVGSTLTKYVTKPALAAGAALGGMALVKGWSRMTEIDSARVKLQAIGNSAKDVEKITNNSLESVSGTAYGMNEAMTTAASAVAAGIKPGKELEKYLTAIADSAAVAGTDMSSMGNIINKVATQGKASNEVLQQMAEAGIPIYQYLADQMGTTAGKVFDMAKDGEIGLSDFQAAVTKHIGGAAKEIGSKTIKGAIANLGASISRVGANFLGSADDADSFAGRILPFIQNLTKKFGGIEEAAKKWGKTFADALIKVINFIKKIPTPILKALVVTLIGLGPAITIILKVVAAIRMVKMAISALSGAFSLLASPIGLIIAAIAALVIGFTILWKKSAAFRNFFIKMWQGIKKVLSVIIKGIVTYFKTAWLIIKTVWTAPVRFFRHVWSKIKGVFSKVGSFFREKFTAAWSAVKGAFSRVGSFFAGVWKTIKDKFTGIGSAIGDAISDAVKTGINGIIGTAERVINKAIGFINKAIGIINKIPKVDIPKIKEVSFPRLAQGGVLARGQVGFLEGSGAEAVVPLERNKEWINKVADDMRVALGSTAGGRAVNITINNKIDGAEKPEEYAARLVRQLKVEMRTI